MTEKRPDKWFDDRIEAFVDRSLPDNERRLFEARLELDPALRVEVARARRLERTLAATPRLRCPSDVRRRVFEMTSARRPRPGRWAWAAAGAMGLAVAVLVAVKGPLNGSPSPAELAQARADMALALAYLDRAGRVAGREVGGQWVTGGIIKPVSAGLSLPARDPATEAKG